MRNCEEMIKNVRVHEDLVRDNVTDETAEAQSANGDKDDRDPPSASIGKKILWFIFRFSVSIALIVWIFKSIDLSLFKQVAVSPRVAPTIAMIAFSLLFVFLGGLKLWVLMRSFSPITLKRFMGYYFLAGSVGSLAPAIIGDFTLIGLVKRSKMSIHQSVSALLMDRFITIIVAVFIFTPFTIALVLPVRSIHIILLTTASALLSGGLVWIVFRFAPSIWREVEIMNNFWKAFSLYFTKYRKDLSINIIICGLRGIISGMTLIFALMAANLNPPVFPTICISNSLSILTHIPISLSGLGVFEGSGLLLFEAIGMNRERVLAGLFYHRVYIIIWAVLTAVILTSLLLWKKRVSRLLSHNH
jgi:uncharacterized membrane protein YbhN (UPF0104 family)